MASFAVYRCLIEDVCNIWLEFRGEISNDFMPLLTI